jgi:CHAT domain-containing protein
LVDLGPLEVIDGAILRWRRAIGHGANRENGTANQQSTIAAGMELAKLVWLPIQTELRGCKNVYLSPAREIAFVSFGALPGLSPESFLLEDHNIAYVSSSRDLFPPPSVSQEPPVVMGAPDYGAPGKPGEFSIALELPVTEYFKPLLHTSTECTAVAKALQRLGPEPVVSMEKNATEQAVKSLRHPSYLHFATHGFFLSGQGGEGTVFEKGAARGIGGTAPIGGSSSEVAPGRNGKSVGFGDLAFVEPNGRARQKLGSRLTAMQRAGIALAKANDTLAGRQMPGRDDGILIADEVSSMDLLGTKLVVISTCDSGLGEVSGGEGVYGLRRAFWLAGAQNLVMSLWPAHDRISVQLMEAMYAKIADGESPQRALLAAQRAFIKDEREAKRWPHPLYWGAFVASGSGKALQTAKTAENAEAK